MNFFFNHTFKIPCNKNIIYQKRINNTDYIALGLFGHILIKCDVFICLVGPGYLCLCYMGRALHLCFKIYSFLVTVGINVYYCNYSNGSISKANAIMLTLRLLKFYLVWYEELAFWPRFLTIKICRVTYGFRALFVTLR